MQKTSSRSSAGVSKVAKKTTKKMGVSPKKKKSPDKNDEKKTKTPVKKIKVVAKKGNVGKKDLKIVKKKPAKLPVKKVVKKPAKKVIKKVAALTKINTSVKSEAKIPEKSEESETVSPKTKKLKKSASEEQSNQNEPIKSTAKKINSKLSKKSNDSEPTVKPTLPSVNDSVKEAPPSPKKKTAEKSKDDKAKEEKIKEDKPKTEQKPKPKKKVVKTPKLAQEKKPAVKKTKRLSSAGKNEPVNLDLIEKIIKTEISSKEIEPEKKQTKKDQEKIAGPEQKEENDNKKPAKKTVDINSRETIAKLLKEANKSILKGTLKKKRDLIKIKTSKTTIVKKTKPVKPKPKKTDDNNTVKTEPQEEKAEKDETSKKSTPVSTPKKVVKKVVKQPVKPKKKTVKIEEKPAEKEEDNHESLPVKIENEEKKRADDEHNTNTDDSTTSDDLTLNQIRDNQTPIKTEIKKPDESSKSESKPKPKKMVKIKTEPGSDSEKKPIKIIKKVKPKSPKNLQQKKKILLLKKKMCKITKDRKRSVSTDSDQKNRKLKLYSWWTGPKRHRVASLNAIAKVHCLYENESRAALNDVIKRSPVPKESNSDPEHHEPKVESTIEASTRTLRSVPGLRGVGKHWEMHDETSSSSSCEEISNDSSVESPKPKKLLTPPPSYKQKQKIEEKEKEIKEENKEKKKPAVRKRRNRTELIMDLKDMVVRKRMASLNASAILAASYSVEKKPYRSPRSEETTETDDSDASVMSEVDKKRKCYDSDISVKKEESQDRKVIEVRASPNKKVAVILNQDTDVTITGVYVNSTTRSTHHEGYCSIAGMQYRISATSHTQTAATAVATETLLHSSGEHQAPPEQPCKSYTPLGALSSMQPPGHGHPHHGPVSPGGRRHGCPSAFSAPPTYGPPTQPPHHHPPPPHPVDQAQPPPQYLHGYYQPAGPLITAHHGHTHGPPAPTSVGKSVPLPTLEASPSPTPPPTTHQPPPSSTGTAESSDNEVIITSASSGSEPVPVALPPPAQTYRYTTQYPPAPAAGSHAPPAYTYSYPPSQYYHSAPGFSSQQQHFHHDICYPGGGYPPNYLHPKAYTTTFRRYLPPPPPAGPQYYPSNQDIYPTSAASGQSSQVVSASSGASGSSYQPPPTGPPPPTLVESYAPPPPVPPTIVEPYPPPHYYSYGSGPAPPACYSHSPPTRNLTFIDAAYQSCPCPMQSCPKNVHTGPLTGDGKRSNVTAIAKESMPLPPVALALPLEPASVAGPPSPARGSAGMPPPPSPAGATYQPTPQPKWDPKQESTETVIEAKTTEKRTKARIGKNNVRNSYVNSINASQGMLLMCHNQPQTTTDVSNVKREVESPEEVQIPEPQAMSPIPARKNDRIPEIETPIEETNQIDSKIETEVQKTITEECNKRLSLDEVNQKLKNEETLPIVDEKIPQVDKIEPKDETGSKEKQINHAERICTKRKLSTEESSDNKKQKTTNSRTKLPNGSYKDLIKKANKCVKIDNGKRKLSIDGEIKPIEPKYLVYKTPKIMLGKKKTTKRKLKQPVSKEEPPSKRVKTSKPLVASNLHNLKQNVKHNKHQINSNLTENKEPKKIQKKTVNSKSRYSLTNVDRTIESVILNSAYAIEESRTSVKEVLKVTDKQTSDVKTDSVKQNSKIIKVAKVGSGRSGASKRKNKLNNVLPVPLPIPRIPRKSLQLPRWSNGWSWEGESYEGKVFLNSDEALVTRKCYPSMRHAEGDIISPRDCVLLKAGPRKIDLPFVAKVAALWEDEEGEMMMSLLWYYRPEHTEQGRRPVDQPDEVFASRHKDTNSVACIEDKCYVLTFNEYCRYRRTVRSIEEGRPKIEAVVPLPEGGFYHREHRQPPLLQPTPPDLVFFCRQVYDFRQKRIVKNPS